MINHIFQPEGSNLCGQTCVAMLAGVTLEESIAAFSGKRGGTRTKEIIVALQKLGIKCDDAPLTRFTGDCFPTDTCIVKLHIDGTHRTHWSVWHEGRYYDPSEAADGLLEGSKNMYPPYIRMTSYLPIYSLERGIS
jgi:hypothetical protein